MKKIDIHAHVTKRPLSGLSERWATPLDLERRMKEYDIEKSVVLATYFPHKGTGVSNFRLYDWVKDRDDMVMFGSVDFEHYFYQGFNELEELASRKALHGLKVYAGYQEIDFHSKEFDMLMGLAGKNDLPVMFHTGDLHSVDDDSRVVDSLKLKGLGVFDKYDGVRFILSHLSSPFFEGARQVAQEYDNVMFDMSGLINSYRERHEIERVASEVNRFVHEAGPSKLLFGTDFPVQTHADSFEIAERAFHDVPYYDQKKIFYTNAREVLKI